MNQLLVVILSLIVVTTIPNKYFIPIQDTIIAKSIHHHMTIAEVLKKNTDKWMKIPGVIGTGEGKSEGKPSIMVFIKNKPETIRKKIPKTVDGYPVILKETGEIQAK